MSNVAISTILSDYRNYYQNYEKLDKIIVEKLEQMIAEKNFFVMDLKHRIKSSESLKSKLTKKHGKYEKIEEITDICGVRIICYFSDTVDDIARAISELFEVDRENTIDKRTVLQDTQFGYLSLHYICMLRQYEGYEEDLTKIKFEIQIRTVLQHAWAEIEHDLGYKSGFGVPSAIRREFSRIASLLEVADDQFVALRENANKYALEVREIITSGNPESLPLDQVSLNEYLMYNISFNSVVSVVEKDLDISVINTDNSKYILQLYFLGAQTLGDLVKLFRANKVLLIQLIKDKVDAFDLDFVTTTMILRYLCRAELIRSNYSDEQIFHFMQISYNDKKAAQSAQKVIEAGKRFREGVHK